MCRAARNVLVLAVSATLSVVAAELLLRVLLPAPTEYRALVPGLETTFETGYATGVQGPSLYKVNSMGVRGREWGPTRGSEYRVLFLGGSATECLITDQRRVWTSLLEPRLGRRPDGGQSWVGNIGRSGLNTRHHVLQMRRLLGVYDPDAVVLVTTVRHPRGRRGADVAAVHHDAVQLRHRGRDPAVEGAARPLALHGPAARDDQGRARRGRPAARAGPGQARRVHGPGRQGEKELEQMVADIRQGAEAEKQRILADAQAQADAMRRDAEQRIAAEIERARAELEREVVAAAIAVAERLLREKATKSDHTQLADSFIQDIQTQADQAASAQPRR